MLDKPYIGRMPLVSLLCCASLSIAQEPEPLSPDKLPIETMEEVRVVAPRLDVGISPYLDADLILGPDAIRAFAVSDLGELLEELGPELDSGRGGATSSRVFLVNGQRIANFNEIRRYPPEAIARVEIYPEEVALQYGFRADQKVVNFVLRSQFRAVTSRFASRGVGDTDGGHGGESLDLDAGYLHVQDAARMNLDLDTDQQSPLHDSDRDVPANPITGESSLRGNVFAVNDDLDPRLSTLLGEPVISATLPTKTDALLVENLLASANAPLSTDVRPLRTLLADQNSEAVSGSYSNLWRERVSATFSGTYRQQQSRTEQGLANLSYRVPGDHPRSPFANDVDVQRLLPVALTRSQDSTRYEANATFAANWRGVAFSWISSYAEEERDATTTQGVDADAFLARVTALDVSLDPFAPQDEVQPNFLLDNTRSTALSSELLARGVLADLASGPLQGSARILLRSNSRQAEIDNGLITSRNRIDRDIAEARFSLDAPLLQSEALGQMSVNVNTELSDYSDFGALSVFGAGFTWKPNSRIRLSSSLTREEGAPSMEQLGDPVIQVPNRRTFDFINGETVDALEISGGNNDLQAELRDVLNLNARIRLLKEPRLTLSLDYVDSITDQPILRFPNQNSEVESAFPERYLRNEAGLLTAFDTRPINLEEEHRREFRWALRYSHEFESPRSEQPQTTTSMKSSEKSQQSRRSGGTGGGNKASRNRGARLRLSLNHVITLEDELTLASDIAPIDYVGVASAGRRRGGAEHFVTFRGTYSHRNMSARLNASWQDATESLPGRSGSLRFESLFRADLDLAYFFRANSSWVQRLPALDGSRVKLSMLNVFDTKPQVSNQFGITPLGSTEDELAPRGRHFALEFRKVFR